MDEEQRFAFDTWGFLTVEDALSSDKSQTLRPLLTKRGRTCTLYTRTGAVSGRRLFSIYWTRGDGGRPPGDFYPTWLRIWLDPYIDYRNSFSVL